jgi:Mg-chelatase subunit ChlI
MIATLKIPSKLRLNTESMQLPVRALEYKSGQHLLQSRHRRLSRWYQGSELNAVDATIVDVFACSIRTALERKDSKDVTITLAKAVAAENGRSSITSAQKAGRTVKPSAKTTHKLRQKPGPKPVAKRTQKQAKIVAIHDNTSDASKASPELVPVPKSRVKHKQIEAEVEVEVEELSPWRLRRRI